MYHCGTGCQQKGDCVEGGGHKWELSVLSALQEYYNYVIDVCYGLDQKLSPKCSYVQREGFRKVIRS